MDMTSHPQAGDDGLLGQLMAGVPNRQQCNSNINNNNLMVLLYYRTYHGKNQHFARFLDTLCLVLIV